MHAGRGTALPLSTLLVLFSDFLINFISSSNISTIIVNTGASLGVCWTDLDNLDLLGA